MDETGNSSRRFNQQTVFKWNNQIYSFLSDLNTFSLLSCSVVATLLLPSGYHLAACCNMPATNQQQDSNESSTKQQENSAQECL
ncbi:MAG: hypothetical protein M3Z26_13175 [Bacteroidota bacterium]|nr:hypothetical protein [Bacteroidota bacterium]